MGVLTSPSLTCRTLTLLTVSAVVIQIIGLSLFVMGFFPVKSTISGTSGLESFFPPDLNHSVRNENVSALPSSNLFQLYQKLSGVPPLFDRLVLMVIDGLPAEFILGRDGKPPEKVFMEAMPYTQSLLAKGKALGYHAKAAPPTVTMPRLKAMVSGAIGGYLDVAFNFNTQALLDDNLIEQFARIGWKMVMFGDDTWIKLFPGKFTRHDGVSSFFVKDTVEVDHNVSRHLNTELNRMDWNLLILHYLGLDHVGHIGGRNSLLMGPKLKEMDEVIKMIDLGTIQGHEGNQERTLLMIVSDHGMTESGNHGGSSFEETDSLALFVGPSKFGPVSKANMVNQVDIASTLALLFGVPIPKENVGIVMTEVFMSLTVDEQLRVMELNSWQLFKLLQAQLPNLECNNYKCDVHENDNGYRISQDYGTVEEMFCCLYLGAAAARESLKSQSMSGTEYDKTFLAYNEFLKTASQWLSSRATDRPSTMLVSGLTALFLSCLILLGILFLLVSEAHMTKRNHFSRLKIIPRLHLDEIFCLAIVCIIMLSMGSSSMVEEEQYIWHFVVSSFYFVLLRKVTQFRISGFMMQPKRDLYRFFSVVVILISGRILRGWHQGGVNWPHLPDISKWLEQAGSAYISSLQLVSGVLLISTYFFALFSSLRSRKIFVMVISVIYLYPALFILYHIAMHRGRILAATCIGATGMVQRFYGILSFSTVGTLFSVPWILPLQNSKVPRDNSHDDITSEHQSKVLLEGLKDSTFVSGWCLMFSWSLLQLLLQQPINSMPLFLVSIQMMAVVLYSSSGDTYWAEVAAIHYLGIAGHFGLGNTNNLATIDVAGAFIGVLSHSTMLSGILMFIITYASPLFSALSLVMYISMKDMCGEVRGKNVGLLLKRNLSFPCLVPLGLNSLLLNAYTVILLLMRNHLFIWSVFSPKYLYVCANTVCVIIGVSIVAASVSYTSLVLSSRII